MSFFIFRMKILNVKIDELGGDNPSIFRLV